MATSTTTVSQPANQPVNPGTRRNDNWWLEPLLVFSGLTLFGIYATWRALVGFGFTDHNLAREFLAAHHTYSETLGYAYYGQGAHYISPFASPDLSPLLAPIIRPIMDAIHNIRGLEWFVISPALWILWVPGGFRVTCYYYRKAYYRSFFQNPPACAVGPNPDNPLGRLLGMGRRYFGEKLLPMAVQNLHRYFFYISALFIVILSIDAFISYFFATGDGGYQFGIKAGSIVLTLNAVFLALYTFSCHSWRHILGGAVNRFSCNAVTQARHHAWERQSLLNHYHMQFAWISLFWVGFTDFYVLGLSRGWFPDVTILSPVTQLTLRLPS